MKIKYTSHKHPTQQQIDNRIDEILNLYMDFDKIKTMMDSVGWTYHFQPNLTIDELRKTAEDRLLEVTKDLTFKESWSSSGGFTAIYKRYHSKEAGNWFRLDLFWGCDTMCDDGISY